MNFSCRVPQVALFYLGLSFSPPGVPYAGFACGDFDFSSLLFPTARRPRLTPNPLGLSSRTRSPGFGERGEGSAFPRSPLATRHSPPFFSRCHPEPGRLVLANGGEGSAFRFRFSFSLFVFSPLVTRHYFSFFSPLLFTVDGQPCGRRPGTRHEKAFFGIKARPPTSRIARSIGRTDGHIILRRCHPREIRG